MCWSPKNRLCIHIRYNMQNFCMHGGIWSEQSTAIFGGYIVPSARFSSWVDLWHRNRRHWPNNIYVGFYCIYQPQILYLLNGNHHITNAHILCRDWLTILNQEIKIDCLLIQKVTHMVFGQHICMEIFVYRLTPAPYNHENHHMNQTQEFTLSHLVNIQYWWRFKV